MTGGSTLSPLYIIIIIIIIIIIVIITHSQKDLISLA